MLNGRNSCCHPEINQSKQYWEGTCFLRRNSDIFCRHVLDLKFLVGVHPEEKQRRQRARALVTIKEDEDGPLSREQGIQRDVDDFIFCRWIFEGYKRASFRNLSTSRILLEI